MVPVRYVNLIINLGPDGGGRTSRVPQPPSQPFGQQRSLCLLLKTTGRHGGCRTMRPAPGRPEDTGCSRRPGPVHAGAATRATPAWNSWRHVDGKQGRPCVAGSERGRDGVDRCVGKFLCIGNKLRKYNVKRDCLPYQQNHKHVEINLTKKSF